MDRRAFLSALGASLLTPRLLHLAPPSAFSATSERPAPIDLGDGIVLIDYRLHPGDHPAIIGEIHNTTDRMIDAPVVSLTFPREDRSDGFTWAPPINPVVDAGGTVPIFGVLPEDINSGELLTTVIFALCSVANPGYYTMRESRLSLEVEIVEDRIRDKKYGCDGVITNTRDKIAYDTVVQGIVRDRDGRVAGSTSTQLRGTIPAGEVKSFSVYAGGTVKNKSNPFPLLNGTDYTVEITAGTRGPVVAPGCTFGRPWD